MKGPIKKTIAYSFKQLMERIKEKYQKETNINNKETIINTFICDPDISKDFLTIYDKMSKDTNLTSKEKISLFNNFLRYYHILQYSLPPSENLQFYNSLKALAPQEMNQYPSYEYLTINDPINNFKNICLKYSLFLNESEDLDKTKINLGNIQNYIDEMLKVYDLNLKNYYYPPRKEYAIYVYNFYSFSFFKTLEKFRKKKVVQSFKNNMKIENNYTESEWININYKIGLFFKQVNKLFNKFNYNNIGKDLKILKIILYYFKSFEYTRDYDSNSETFRKMINSLNTESVTSDILKRFKFYTKDNKIITEENWDSIGINENVYIKHHSELSVRIKHFNRNILNIDDKDDLFSALSQCSIENLNIDGITQNSIIKFSPEIEKYSKKLLKSILSSKKYRDSFLKYDKRFISKITLENLLKNIFNGPNSEAIFEEIWDNIFFLPFLGNDFAGFNSRDQYSVFINSNPEFIFKKATFQKIIPYYHCQLNTLFHEYTHNIALLIAANLEKENFEKIVLNDEIELKELVELQNEYSKKYNQNNKIYTSFDDFGDLMEVEMYGIRPRKFKTFSGLFCLDCNSYNLEPNEFREKCVGLYNFNINNNKNSKEKIKNEGKYNFDELLKGLLDSEIAKILYDYFVFDSNLQNESFIEDGKPRGISFNSLFNEEITIDIDYCDKLS